jgi:hypothetical protein
MDAMEPEKDTRSEDRKMRDEQAAAEAPKPRPLSHGAGDAKPMEAFLKAEDLPRPKAVVGVVEKGLVRPLDPGLQLPERCRVLIVGEW